jgi:hypothetical protein
MCNAGKKAWLGAEDGSVGEHSIQEGLDPPPAVQINKRTDGQLAFRMWLSVTVGSHGKTAN